MDPFSVVAFTLAVFVAFSEWRVMLAVRAIREDVDQIVAHRDYHPYDQDADDEGGDGG